ncbi:MAG: metallophosphoesterase [Desulfobacterales bacterium]|nr:metallophosphoesterase [Desulfobacterales bacterium]
MNDQSNARQQWISHRAEAEKTLRKKAAQARFGKVRRIRGTARLFERLIMGTPLYKRGLANAASPRLVKKDMVFSTLPAAFNGYTVLHLTDLHLDFIPDLAERICRLVKGVNPDLCVMTGDYVTEFRDDVYKGILGGMEQIVSAVNAEDGTCATLGNHDTWRMVDPFEHLGIRVLLNETYGIRRKNTGIAVTGVDDPHEFLTAGAIQALKAQAENSEGKKFKIALVHTPELYQEAGESGCDLYLAGHTHGGQICLPGGIPLVLHLNKGHRYGKGQWRYRSMTGYTSQGAGAVGIPVRLNTFSEITLITLYSAAIMENKNGSI